MGRQLHEEDPTGLLASLWERAEELSGLPIRQLSIDGPIEELTRTEVAQPALFTVSVALDAAARELGLQPEMAAGHSLGEYSALVAAGALEPEDGLRLVVERGRLMAIAQVQRPGSMAAIGGIDMERLQAVCEAAAGAGTVVISNQNSPLQLVVAGEHAGVERAMELALAAGAEQATRLPVGAAFHSPLMEPVRVAMAELIDATSFRDPGIPVLSNSTGTALNSAAAIKAALIEQVTSPVRWTECVQTFVAAGQRVSLELGPGRVLTGLSRQTDPDLVAFAADSREKIETAIRMLSEQAER